MKFAKNGKLFGIISIIDLLVVIVAALILKTAFDKLNVFNGSISNVSIDSESQVKEFEYTAKIRRISSTSIDMLKVDDEVYDKTSGTMIGYITGVSYERAKYEFEAEDGNIYMKEYPEKVDVTLTIKAYGSKKDGQYLANNLIRILVGENKMIKTKYVEFEANIIDIKMGE